jgi:hypothetical protein
MLILRGQSQLTRLELQHNYGNNLSHPLTIKLHLVKIILCYFGNVLQSDNILEH